MIKKYLITLLIAGTLPALVAFAATPSISVSGSGDGNNVNVNVTNADANSPVVLYYTATSDNTTHSQVIGITGSTTPATFSGSVSTNGVGINATVPVYVIVNGSQSNSVTWPYFVTATSTSQVRFSQNNPNLMVGQNGSVTVSGGNGNYYIASNSNSGIANASLSGNTLSFSGVANGTSAITVCSTNSSNCAIINVTVNTNTTGSLSLSQSILNLGNGQTGTIQIFGGTTPYTLHLVSGNSATASLSGNIITVSANAIGTQTFNVCSANGFCTPLTVNVSTQNQPPTSTVPFTLGLAINEMVTLSMTGGNGGTYFLQSGLSTPVTASISGNTLTVRGVTYGSATAYICQNGIPTCLPVNFIVNRAATPPIIVPGTGGPFFFSHDLWLGLTSSDVTELQNFLKAEGYFTATATGYFGPITFAAVQRFQTANGITATGYVGPLTRAALNR
jgi:hypothetical protein